MSSLAPALREFSLLANLTCQVQGEACYRRNETNSSRPLSISRLIVNPRSTLARCEQDSGAPAVQRQWCAHRAVGADGLQDIYEEPRHLLDLTVVQGIGKHFELKATVKTSRRQDRAHSGGSRIRMATAPRSREVRERVSPARAPPSAIGSVQYNWSVFVGTPGRARADRAACAWLTA